MKKISMIFIGAFLALSASVCSANSQNLQIFSVDNSKGAINAKTVEKAFGDVGVIVDVNNDMNSIFSKRYGKVHHKKYRHDNTAYHVNLFEFEEKMLQKRNNFLECSILYY
jgi:hypothetical protein